MYWSGEHGIQLFNSWDLTAEQQKNLSSYWERFEHYIKPHSNELIAVRELHNLRQGNMSLEEFIAKLRILVKEANYLVEHNDQILRDFLVLGINSDRVRKDCFKEGNDLTFNKARENVKGKGKQLQSMNRGTPYQCNENTPEPKKPAEQTAIMHCIRKSTTLQKLWLGSPLP